ncbi:hypothetical protein PV10_08329 [Exophiala mesophila]|uniref:UDP-N-acetylglucosamine transferase subunit ALG14 n=1 Tax=Exophiala mesophila TaxID=212818 RepID=A0A0D1ZPG0_EXOME|nr:uncharacterized protein PV10_08329 [Exophiala mesophila]KIV88668.1 hypothetical protein PV10_08329 [Exophiala mesophila]
MLTLPINMSTQGILLLAVIANTIVLLVILFLVRLSMILSRQRPPRTRPQASTEHPTHLLVVLGSGGHTAEMINILSSIPNLNRLFTHRTYVVSSGDSFSAQRAHDFENQLSSRDKNPSPSSSSSSSSYTIATIYRARKIHQPLLTTPFSSLKCLKDSLQVLRQHDLYPDLILTNGPGTGVIVVLASIILLFFGLHGPVVSHASSVSASASPPQSSHPTGRMRSIYIESWARVRTLSLSGRILKPLVDRFLVQWPQLAVSEDDGVGVQLDSTSPKPEFVPAKAEFIGPLVS